MIEFSILCVRVNRRRWTVIQVTIPGRCALEVVHSKNVHSIAIVRYSSFIIMMVCILPVEWLTFWQEAFDMTTTVAFAELGRGDLCELCLERGSTFGALRFECRF